MSVHVEQSHQCLIEVRLTTTTFEPRAVQSNAKDGPKTWLLMQLATDVRCTRGLS